AVLPGASPHPNSSGRLPPAPILTSMIRMKMAQSHLTGALATSRQGQAVIREALASTTVAGAASFLGALLPPAVGVVLPGPSWVPLAISVATLGAPGTGIGAAMGRALAR
ncbi:hypothetical protein ACIBK1_33395, partial [Microbispora rosea]